MKNIRIGNKNIGKDQPAFIIAEAGINHDGELRKAKELIRQAKRSGADAIKFQTFKAESLCTKGSEYFDLFKSLEFDRNGWLEIAALAKRSGITFLSTPFDEESADLLDGLGVVAYKIASGDLTHLPFLRYVARKRRPILLSTGMSDLKEIDESLRTIYGSQNKRVILLHCVSSYPADVNDVNLKAINTLEQKFKVPVGFSDHTIGVLIPVVAVCLGARVIEKHFTLDKNAAGPDHKLSLEPTEFKTMTEQIRMAERSYGDGKKKPRAAEMGIMKAARRSIIARVGIAKGGTIAKDMLKISRPGTGIAPKFLLKVIGKSAKEEIEQDEVLTWAKIR